MINRKYIDPETPERWRDYPVEVIKDGERYRIFQGASAWSGVFGSIKVNRHNWGDETEAQAFLDMIAQCRNWIEYKGPLGFAQAIEKVMKA